jgi:hypothetical protein
MKVLASTRVSLYYIKTTNLMRLIPFNDIKVAQKIKVDADLAKILVN